MITQRILGLFGYVFALWILTATMAHAQTETVLYSFSPVDGTDSDYPSALIMDKLGNLYGTTGTGAGISYGFGTVFELTPAGVETTLYTFTNSNGDGGDPVAGVIMDNEGNFYGTTSNGGSYGYGTVFKLTPAGVETPIYSFTANGDGANPWGGLVVDKKGNIYGTTRNGGVNDGGAVFRLTRPRKGGSWSETVLYNFLSQAGDGRQPYVGVIIDKLGNLYGTTEYGGLTGQCCGTVYELMPSGQSWTEKTLHAFSDTPDGAYTYAGVVMDKMGNLYGVTYWGGAYGFGAVYQITPGGAETVLYSFTNSNGDGANPVYGPILGKKGYLYGTTYYGGKYGYGAVYELIPSGGSWKEKILWSFSGQPDGANPTASMTLDKHGNLYGTTRYGGSNGYGTVYKIAPK